MRKKDKKTKIFPKKAFISIWIPKENISITGLGVVDATKNSIGEFVFTATLIKEYD